MKNKTKQPCIECRKATSRMHPILQLPLCQSCQRERVDKYRYITKTRALQEYRLRPYDLSSLGCHEVDNPYYKKAAPMQLYLLNEIEELSKKKWGSTEPYIVTLHEFDQRFLSWLLEDLERLKQLSPEKFQLLIADRLEQLGLGVQIVGNIYRKDGGVDIIAYPISPSIPFLLAVQAKHHCKNRMTTPRDVRDFHGAVASRNSPFHMGMIVTNTTFTPDAKWFANENSNLLRLRDLDDLKRWLQEDFANEYEWREIPKQVELAPGVVIEIPRPQIIIPKTIT